MPGRPIRIGIDIRELTKPQAGGFRTYVRGLLQGLAACDHYNEYVLYGTSSGSIPGALPGNSVVRLVTGNRLAQDHCTLKRAVRRDNLDVVHFPCNYGLLGLSVPMVITLHDAISLKKCNATNMKSRLLSIYSHYMIRRSTARAERVVTISNYSQEAILRHFGISDKLDVIYQGHLLKADTTAAQCPPTLQHLSETDYVLLLASVDTRKNTSTVIEAFAKSTALRSGCRLVAVSSHPSVTQMLQTQAGAHGISKACDIADNVDDSLLRWLYSHAVAFVFASLEEGFGLPPLEAMASGCPVISSSASAMPEVLGEAAAYFDPLNPGQLAQTIDNLFANKQLLASMRELGYQQAALYDWDQTAQRTLEVYISAVDHHTLAGQSNRRTLN